MTRVVIDTATMEKLHGLAQFMEFCDERGNVLGRFQPDENSPTFRAWLRNLDPGISEEEMRRRVERGRREGISTEQVLERLQGGAK
jgi:hypothetical protein